MNGRKSWWVSFRDKLDETVESVAANPIVTQLFSLMEKYKGEYEYE